ncbi:MAG: ClpXP protease specificity-enhancing factor [Betaproteobacteria bacterium]|nr:ClpXP protease specificity-enhancing factor [Betaproteobacteria bacterium]
MTQDLPSTKPYLLRALYEWCCDGGFTPYIAVVVDSFARVPQEFVRDGQIVLNIGPEATGQLTLGNEIVSFRARFGGVAREISFPVGNIAAIYAKENGAGMAFEVELGKAEPKDDSRNAIALAISGDEDPLSAPTPSAKESDDGKDKPPSSPRRSHLQRIK